MSTSITPVTPDIADYLGRMFSAEDDFLQQLNSEATDQGIPPIRISGEQGAFLQLLLRSINATTVIEIGSLAGYSAILMARALPADGKLICIEVNPDYCSFIQRKAREAGLDHVIDVRCGRGIDVLAAIDLRESVDFVFIDADKPNYVRYFDAALPLLRRGGIVCADNTLAWGEIAKQSTEFEPQNVRALQEYNAVVRQHPGCISCLVPLGDGMTLAMKK